MTMTRGQRRKYYQDLGQEWRLAAASAFATRTTTTIATTKIPACRQPAQVLRVKGAGEAIAGVGLVLCFQGGGAGSSADLGMAAARRGVTPWSRDRGSCLATETAVRG